MPLDPFCPEGGTLALGSAGCEEFISGQGRGWRAVEEMMSARAEAAWRKGGSGNGHPWGGHARRGCGGGGPQVPVCLLNILIFVTRGTAIR